MLYEFVPGFKLAFISCVNSVCTLNTARLKYSQESPDGNRLTESVWEYNKITHAEYRYTG